MFAHTRGSPLGGPCGHSDTGAACCWPRARRTACAPAPPPPLAGPDPADPNVRVPPAAYRSPIPASAPAARSSRPHGRARAVARRPRPRRSHETRDAASGSHCRDAGPCGGGIHRARGLRMVFAGRRHGRGAGRCGVGARQGRRRGALAGGGRDRPRRGGASPAAAAHANAAIEIALLDNRELQAAYNELGISEAALVKATLPPSPTFSLSDIAGGGAFEFERQAVVSILALATLPARADIAGDRFHQAQLKAALATLRLAAQTRRAYYRAVAARALARFLEEATASAESAAQLSRRLGESGSASKLDQARDLAFYADLTARDGRRPPTCSVGARRSCPPPRRVGRRSQFPFAQCVAAAAAPAAHARQCRG